MNPRPPTLVSTRVSIATLLTGVTCIGFAPIFVRLSDVGPSATAFYRVLFAMPVLWVWMLRQDQAPPPPTRPAGSCDFPMLALAGMLFVGDLAIWHWSLQYTTVANSTLLTNVAPVFVTLGAWMLLGERITAGFLAGLALGLVGASLLVGAGPATAKTHLLGDILSIVAAVFYAGYLLMVKRLRRQFTGLTILAWSGLVSCPGFLLGGWTLGEQLWPRSLQGWLAVLGLAWISHLGGQTLIATALGHLSASFSSVGLLLQPVIAGVLAWMLFDETLSMLQIVGGLLVLGGIALVTRQKPNHGLPAPLRLTSRSDM